MSDGGTGCFVKPVEGLLRALRSTFPMRIDDDLPDLDVTVWRYSFDRYAVRLMPRGGTARQEVYCLVRIWIPRDADASPHLDLERWVSRDARRSTQVVPRQSLPASFLEPETPEPSSTELEDVAWIALLSRRKAMVSPTGAFYGRIVSREARVRLRSCIAFLWTHCWRVALSMLAWLAAVLVAAGFSLLVVINTDFQHWLVGHLQPFFAVWKDLSQPAITPTSGPAPP